METERKTAYLIHKQVDEVIEYKIPFPHHSSFKLIITIAVFSGCPIIILQDMKHNLKTFHNNLFSGAHLLVLGNEVALYCHI